MSICLICDDSGLQNSDSAHPEFCYCVAGKLARRQWETDRATTARENQPKFQGQPKAASFIDITHLEEVNASVDSLRASLLGSASSEPMAATKHPAVQLLYQVAHAGHEVTITESTQLHDLAQALEAFLGDLAPIGRNLKR